MDKLELIVFNVGHGLSVALIEHPSKYMTLIDLGASTGFTPLKYLLLNRKIRPDILYITHPHADHIMDIDSAIDKNFMPSSMRYQIYNWKDVIDKEQPKLKQYVEAYVLAQKIIPAGSYKGEGVLKEWYLTPEKAKEIFGETNYINNSSIFLIYTWGDFKIAIAGDHHKELMEAFINSETFLSSAKGTDILIAPHHGHSSGYTGLWPEKVGKPYVTIASVDENNPNVDSGYSSNFSKGIPFNSETRYLLTTREDGNIEVNMWYKDGKPTWNFAPL